MHVIFQSFMLQQSNNCCTCNPCMQASAIKHELVKHFLGSFMAFLLFQAFSLESMTMLLSCY